MKKLLILFLAVLILTISCGCRESSTSTDDASSDIKIIFPLDDTVNGYRQEGIKEKLESSNGTDEIDGYYVNTKTKKFHKLSCTYAQKGSQNGVWQQSDRDTLINEGFSPCSKCTP